MVREQEIPADAPILQYAALSPEAQAALQDALTDDGRVYGEANTPPEFSYEEHAALYFIERNGTYYRLNTYSGGGLPLGRWIQAAVGLFGSCVGLVGVAAMKTRARWVPLVVGSSGVLVLGATATWSEGYSIMGLESGIVLIVVALVGSGVAVGAAASLRIR